MVDDDPIVIVNCAKLRAEHNYKKRFLLYLLPLLIFVRLILILISTEYFEMDILEVCRHANGNHFFAVSFSHRNYAVQYVYSTSVSTVDEKKREKVAGAGRLTGLQFNINIHSSLVHFTVIFIPVLNISKQISFLILLLYFLANGILTIQWTSTNTSPHLISFQLGAIY